MRHNCSPDQRRPEHGGSWTPKDDTGLERKMESARPDDDLPGGVIGTGLFVNSGYTIHQAGPLGAYSAVRGRLPARRPCDGLAGRTVRGHAVCRAASRMYAKRFIGPGTAFTIAILVLAELGGGARIGVHGGRAADAAMVSSFAVLGVVGRVHCGGVRAWYGRWPRSG